MSKQTEVPRLVLWCKSLPWVLWLVGWFRSRHSRVEGPFLSCSAALIARAGVRSTTCVQACERADSNYNGTFPYRKHAASVVTFRLWILWCVYYLHHVAYILRPRREVNLAYWHYWQVFNSASNAVFKVCHPFLKKLNKFHVTFHNWGEQLTDKQENTYKIGRSCSK